MQNSQSHFLPYGRQLIDDDDISAVVSALRSDYLTTGPLVEAFEHAFAAEVGAAHAVVCANGTAALHLTTMAMQVGPGDVCIVPTLTFLSTANCVRFQGADVLFADVDPTTGLLTAETLENALARSGGRPVKAILPVHLAGRAADLPALRAAADRAGAFLVEDACHALGTRTFFEGVPAEVGSGAYGDMACFSFHPVKTITSGEGGMVTTQDAGLAGKLRLARSHGMERGPETFLNTQAGFDGNSPNPWYYEQQTLGFNYRLPDILCALGLSQLSKLERFRARRRALTDLYDSLLIPLAPHIETIASPSYCDPLLHLYVVRIDFEALGSSRRQVMERLRERGVGSQVHYIPVHTQPYYQALYGPLDLPGANTYYRRTLSLPLYAGMTEDDVQRVVEALAAATGLPSASPER